MTLVLADGTIARSGGKVVKNVAGYDLCKLLTGSLGTLAVITEATFRLHPLPQHPQTFTVSAPQAAQLAPLMATIRASHLLTQALQLRGDSNGFHLDIQLNAHPEAHQDDILKQMTESAGLKLDELATARAITARERHNRSRTSNAPAHDGGSSGLQAAESNPATKAGFSPGSFTSTARERFQASDIIIKALIMPESMTSLRYRMAGTVTASPNPLGLMYASLRATYPKRREDPQAVSGNYPIHTVLTASWTLIAD